MQLTSTTFWLMLLLACASYQACAQTNFRPGYVLPLTGDTLKGEVDQRDARLSAQRCRFRRQAGETVTTYLPGQARAYGLADGGPFYRVQTVPTGDSLLAAGVSYFMEVVADGPAQLYFLRNEQNRERYYVASPVLPLALLKHEMRPVLRDGRRYEEEQTAFRQTLAKALAGCAPAQVQLPTLPYLESSLRRVVQLYNACQGVRPSKRASKANALSVSVGIVGGLHRSQFNFGDGARTHAPSLTPYTGLTGGLTLGLVAPRISRKISMQVGALYERQRYDIEYVEPYAGGILYQQRSEEHLDLTYLRFPLMLRYTYPRGIIRPLLEVGMIYGRAFVRDNTYQTTDFQGNKAYHEPLVRNESIEGSEISLGGGLGLTATVLGGRAICLLLRTEKATAVAKASTFSSTELCTRLMLSLDLIK